LPPPAAWKSAPNPTNVEALSKPWLEVNFHMQLKLARTLLDYADGPTLNSKDETTNVSSSCQDITYLRIKILIWGQIIHLINSIVCSTRKAAKILTHAPSSLMISLAR